MPEITLLNIDCMEYMKTLENKAFDLAIVDPPYGIGESSRNVISRHHTQAKYKRSEWDKEPPPPEYFKELRRVSKNQIVFGANHFISRLPIDSSCWIYWHKDRYGDFADGELAWTSFNTAVRAYKFTWDGFRKQMPQERIHPTEKPVNLYKWLLENYATHVCTHKHTAEYDSLCSECKNRNPVRILDTHGGSRSLAIACHEMGFDHVSCEIDTDYHNDSVKRFKEQTMQQKLFI